MNLTSSEDRIVLCFDLAFAVLRLVKITPHGYIFLLGMFYSYKDDYLISLEFLFFE